MNQKFALDFEKPILELSKQLSVLKERAEESHVDFSDEIDSLSCKLEETKKKLLSEIARCKGMLANPNFTNKAPKEKVQAEVDKLANYEKQFAEVEKSIKDLM